jgi:hypothetical protein
MMGAGNLASEGMLDLMIEIIEVGDAIGTRGCRRSDYSVNLLSLLVQIMVNNLVV